MAPGDRILAPWREGEGNAVEYFRGEIALIDDVAGMATINWDDGTYTEGIPVDALVSDESVIARQGRLG